MKFGGGTGSERSASDTNLAHLLNDVGEDVLNERDDEISHRCRSRLVNLAYFDRSKRRPRELQCPLDLEPMGGR